MTNSNTPDHDALVALMWELKAAWLAGTGKDILLTNLLLDRKELDRFLAEAGEATDPEVRRIVARILTVRAALGPVPSSPPGSPTQRLARVPERPVVQSVPTATPATPKSGFDVARGGAALLASVLLSVAAIRYLFFAPVALPAPVMVAATAPARAEAPATPAVPVTALAAVTPAKAAPPPQPSLADSDLVLRIHGSNTVGEKLCPALMQAFLRSKGATQVTLVPGKAPDEKALIASMPGHGRPQAVEIFAHGSSTAFVDLAAGSADLGQSSRRIKPEEVATLLEKHGDLSKPGSEHVIALDGLAIVVHPGSRVTSLSIDQIAAIFSGKVKDWSEIGGEAGPIDLYARDDASGTWDTFKNLVLAPAGATLDPSAKRLESSSDLSDAVASDPHAIGFIGLPYVRRAKLLAVSAKAGSMALVPTPFTVSTEDYPLSRRLYFYSPADAASPMMAEFLDFTLSDAGQAVVKQEGFVSQDVSPTTPTIDASAPAEYRKSTEGSQRLSLNFRFQAGSEELDAKALRDLDRIVALLARDSGREVLLLGFTDDRGNAKTNVSLSKARAQVVAKALESRGVFSKDVLGFGAALPVATNDTEDGRNRNRRVEVWIR